MSNHSLKAEILKNMEQEKESLEKEISEKTKKELAMADYAIAALKGLVVKKFKHCNTFDRIEYEFSTGILSKKINLIKPHIRCSFPQIQFQISHYTEFYSVGKEHNYEYFRWDDEKATEHYLIVTKKTLDYIIRTVYDELQREGIFFAVEIRGRNNASLTYNIVNYQTLYKMAASSYKKYPYIFLHDIHLILYLN